MPPAKKRLGYDPLSVLVGEAEPAPAGPVTELALGAIGPTRSSREPTTIPTSRPNWKQASVRRASTSR